jgi:hypothetical protein
MSQSMTDTDVRTRASVPRNRPSVKVEKRARATLH